MPRGATTEDWAKFRTDVTEKKWTHEIFDEIDKLLNPPKEESQTPFEVFQKKLKLIAENFPKVEVLLVSAFKHYLKEKKLTFKSKSGTSSSTQVCFLSDTKIFL